MHEIFRLKKWLIYQWRAKTKYYLHSPFVYQFYLNVLEVKPGEKVIAIQNLCKELSHNNTVIPGGDFGSGKAMPRKISELEARVAVRPKYGLVLYRLVKQFNPQVVLELGTSIGISSAYMAIAKSDTRVVTIEGSARLIEIATTNYGKLKLKNVETIQGNFNDCLEAALSRLPAVDLVFFDGNHNKEATLRYFEMCLAKSNENSIFIFDDIYWSPEMSEAWEVIKGHQKIKLTLDIYQFGICFFIPSKLAKEDFILRY